MQPSTPAVSSRASGTLELALAGFDAAADHLRLEPGLRRVLRQAKRELAVSFPVRMRDGSLRLFDGFRVQHSIARGPAAGGIRYHPDLSLETVRALAMWSSWRAAVVRIPFGGAYGGVVCDPAALAREELERLTRRFTTEIAILIGPERDIPSPDRSTDGQVMAWMMDTYSMHRGYSVPAVVTGKPVAIGGSQGWARCSGRGTAILVRGLARLAGLDLADARIAVQGCGPIGATAARVLHGDGSRVVALADGQHGLHLVDGLDIASALRHFDEHGTLLHSATGTPIDGASLAAVPCDLLVLSGFERIDAEAAGRVQARLIVEGAYGAITPEADAILRGRGITVLPDILGGAGGAVASYFEWVQDLQESFWSEQDIQARLDEVLSAALIEVHARAVREQISLRLAAYALAVERVAEAHRVRGLYP